MKEGVIEKVLVPHRNPKRAQTGAGKVQCIRLVDQSENRDDEKDDVIVLSAETGVEEDDGEDDSAGSPGKLHYLAALRKSPTETSADAFHLKTNVVFHRQIIDLLDNSGTRGMTLSVRV